MKKNTLILLIASIAMSSPAVTAGNMVAKADVQLSESRHFISDTIFRTKVETAFVEKNALFGGRLCTADDLARLKTDACEAEALRFLYAYMPLADVTDYPIDFFVQNVRSSFQARQEMAWGRAVPELLFRHFVLPIRVNNENLDNSRQVFFSELRERVRGLSMKDAILEVNHWCHERVTYQPSDARTSAPLATVRSAYGRCGEESTFTVAALRAIGIPARQVYTPRWAHTDDNHAWVEAWADGEWYFIGACEPEPVLNLAWFNAPASRAMLMHTKAFGDYDGPEEVMLRTANYTEINLIDNYGSSARIDFRIVDAAGKPVDGARVDFKIYNYAEYCTVVSKYTAGDGATFLTAGLGDMLVWASKNGRYGFAKASFGKDKQITIVLERAVTGTSAAYRDSFDIVPPAEHYNIPEVSQQQRQENNRRFAYEDSLRHAYMATFLTEQTAKRELLESGLPDDDQLAAFLVTSRGNHDVILQFLANHKDGLQRARDLLVTLSDKDLRDMPLEILEDSYLSASAELCPRVENEMIIHPFKRFFENAFSKSEAEKFRNNPARLVEWVKGNIRLLNDKKAWNIAQTPIGVWQSGLTDVRSRKIFFVDVARSLGIRARVDAVTSKLQYQSDGEWLDVVFEESVQKSSRKGRLVLRYADNGAVDDPKYYSHFTLTRVNADGSTSLLEYPEDGITWSNTFKEGVEIDEGDYALVTGTRLANGGVLSEMQLLHVAQGSETVADMHLRTSSTDVTVIGNFDSESKFRLLDGKEASILSQTGRGYFVTGLIGVGQEPTNHALKDIAKVAEVFESWNRPMLLLFEDEASARKFNKDDFAGLPSNIIFGIDHDGAIRQQVASNMKLANSSQLPVFIISDTFNRVVFLSQGYTIGLGEQMEKVVRKL